MSGTVPPNSLEAVRAYWNRRPCNIRHSNKMIGSREYFDDLEQRRYFVEPHIPDFAQFERWKGKRVLEIGCGIGTDAINFARAGADYAAVELSDVSLELARRRFEIFGLNADLKVANAEELSRSFAPSSFDLVYSFGVIHHTPKPRAVIEETRKVIRTDGELRIMLYAQHSWKAIMIEEGFDQPEAQSGCPIALTYSIDEIHRLLAGQFEAIEVRHAHIFPYVLEKYVKYEYELQPWFKVMPREMFEALARHLGWHSLVVARPI